MKISSPIPLPLTFAQLAAGSGGATLFTANGNYTSPRAGNYLVLLQAGGGGGGGGGSTAAVAGARGGPGQGGAAGEYNVSVQTLTNGQVVAVALGAAGAAGAIAADGGAGG